MKYDFEEVIDRHHTNSSRYDDALKYDVPDLIPLTTADMNFRTAPCIIDAIRKMTDNGIFGYYKADHSYSEALIEWHRKRHDFMIEKDWIMSAPGVINGFSYVLYTATEPGDEIVFLSPMYHPFARKIKNSDRKVVRSSMIFDGEKYHIDFVDLEEKLASDQCRMMIFCNPHNPIGIVFTYEEIRQVTELCLKHHVLLVSDEIHADFIYSENKYYSAGKVAQDMGESAINNLVICTAASKSFNIAGLQNADIIIPNEELRQKYSTLIHTMHIFNNNSIGIAATQAAYQYGEEWLDELLKYLEANRDFIIQYARENWKDISVIVPEATYLIWLDCRRLNMDDDELKNFFVYKCGVLPNLGSQFGPEGKGFVRLNFALPRSELKKVLDKITAALN